MVEAVEQRDDDRVRRRAVWDAFERVLELGRLRRHPEDVHRTVERRCGRHLGVEVAQQGALDVDDAAVARERLVPHQK